MRHIRYLLCLLALAGAAAGPLLAGGPIKIVATVPNLGSLAREVGGDRVQVTTVATATQDPHFVDPKPSFILKLRSADLLLLMGLDLEIGWVPPLTQGSRNGKVQVGGKGYIDCSTGVSVVEVPTGPVSRAGGDVHPYGNPHYLSDPLNAEIVADHLAEVFTKLSPADAALFESRRADFVKRLHVAMFGEDLTDLVGGAKLARLARSGELASFLDGTEIDGKALSAHLGGWLARMKPFAGTHLVTYHKDYSYFAQRFGLVVVEYVEPKPGIPPSAKHLVELKDRLAQGDVPLLLTRPYVEHRSTDLLAEETGIPVLVLPMEVGGVPEATDYIALYDYATSRIASSLAAAGAKDGSKP